MATTPTASPFNTFVTNVEKAIIDPLITVIALAAFILFIYGIFEFIRGADNDEKRKLGQQHIIWGLIGLTIMFGAKTIVSILTRVVS
ncbi:MAG: hypothetical protein ABIT47_01240 [Candidatus Paceibacterota bacterium]